MYRVTTYRLGPDGTSTVASMDADDRGEMDAVALTTLLDRFANVHPAENEDRDPHIVVAGRGAKLIVRTSRGRLNVYDMRDHSAPGTEMSVAGLLERLDRVGATSSPFSSPDEELPQPPPTAPHKGIAFAMLVVGLLLNGYILYSVFYVESVNKKVPVTLMKDPAVAAAKEAALAGTYATGTKTGDRVIEVGATGKIRFFELGAKGPINEYSDSYQVGFHEGILCLSTVDNGVVDLVGENLVYYKDVYQRRRPSAKE